MLERLIERIPWRPHIDRLVFVGDYIDRGPDSRGVIEIILRLKALDPDLICLRGNHEAMLLDYLQGRHRELFFHNGGRTTLASYGVEAEREIHGWLPEPHRAFLDTLPLYVQLEEAYAVHAGLRPGLPLEEQQPHEMLWIRNEFIRSEFDFGKRVIFGHTPFDRPLMMPNKIGIDTGAVYGNRLTCLELPAERFYSVEP